MLVLVLVLSRVVLCCVVWFHVCVALCCVAVICGLVVVLSCIDVDVFSLSCFIVFFLMWCSCFICDVPVLFLTLCSIVLCCVLLLCVFRCVVLDCVCFHVLYVFVL